MKKKITENLKISLLERGLNREWIEPGEMAVSEEKSYRKTAFSPIVRKDFQKA